MAGSKIERERARARKEKEEQVSTARTISARDRPGDPLRHQVRDTHTHSWWCRRRRARPHKRTQQTLICAVWAPYLGYLAVQAQLEMVRQ